MASQQHYGKIKWYNHKRGFGFITDTSTKTFFVHLVHFSGLKRSLQRRLPREGEKVHFSVCEGDKGPEARFTARSGNDPAKKKLTQNRKYGAQLRSTSVLHKRPLQIERGRPSFNFSQQGCNGRVGVPV
ncbi:Cold shock-like protein CspB [Portunus trituberculatus]|uniref:Cold shock-like protein CspB n=1 Tax=Portunus trituberculatus TaxID=210409 RepID=A0A5B7H657_PORTR|nr:Cold shock-like protein CspB [Portunus trituberculatus]